MAKRLIERFGSFAEVVNAPPERLKEVEGIGDAAIVQLKLVRAAALRLMQGEHHAAPGPDLVDRRGRLLPRSHGLRGARAVPHPLPRQEEPADRRRGAAAGTVDHTPVYVREVVKRALELSASAIILVHNHPSGDPTPSRADIDMTQQIVDAAKPLGVTIHDHIIVGRQGHASFKGLKLI